MRLKQCKRCGEPFEASGSGAYCSNCLKIVKSETVLKLRTCIDCGGTFTGGPRAKRCPECRRKAYLEYRKETRKTKPRRKLGSIDKCKRCGAEYIVNGGRQMYCPSCAEIAIKEKIAPKKRAYAAGRTEIKNKRRKELKENLHICVVCGNTYTSKTATITCSAECAEKLKNNK